jgi:hypothetical protein
VDEASDNSTPENDPNSDQTPQSAAALLHRQHRLPCDKIVDVFLPLPSRIARASCISTIVQNDLADCHWSHTEHLHFLHGDCNTLSRMSDSLGTKI